MGPNMLCDIESANEDLIRDFMVFVMSVESAHCKFFCAGNDSIEFTINLKLPLCNQLGPFPVIVCNANSCCGSDLLVLDRTLFVDAGNEA